MPTAARVSPLASVARSLAMTNLTNAGTGARAAPRAPPPSALARPPGDRLRSMSPGPGLNGRPSS